MFFFNRLLFSDPDLFRLTGLILPGPEGFRPTPRPPR